MRFTVSNNQLKCSKEYAMGEHQGAFFEPQFNRSVKVRSTDHRITSSSGVIFLRDAEHRLGLFAKAKFTRPTE